MITHTAAHSRPIWVLVATACVLDFAGAQHVYTVATVAAAVLSCLALLWLVPAQVWQSLAYGEAGPTRLLALLPIVSFAAAMIDLARFVPAIDQGGGWTAPRLWGLAFGIGMLLALAFFKVGWVAIGSLFVGTWIRTIHMEYIPIKPENGDMLPLVNGAIENLLAGRSPYQMYQMPWEVPLTYLPVTWLAYVPTYLLNVDLRWTNISAELMIAAALVWLSAQRNSWSATWRYEPGLALWAWIYLQPSVIHWDMGNTAPITWALLAWLLAFVVAGRPRASAILLGLTAAGSPLVAVFGPFIGLWWLRKYGFGQALRLAFLSGVVAGLVVLPFLLWSPQEFITGTYRWFNNIDGWPRQKWTETDPNVWSIITGYSGEFWARDTEHLLKPIQMLIVGVIALLFWLRGAQVEEVCNYAAAAYLGFMLFNPVLWPYLYNPVLIAGLVAVAGLSLPQSAHAAISVPTSQAASIARINNTTNRRI